MGEQFFDNVTHLFIITASRDTSPVRMMNNNHRIDNNRPFNGIVNHVLTNGNNHSEENLYINGNGTVDHSDDEYIDTVEVNLWLEQYK